MTWSKASELTTLGAIALLGGRGLILTLLAVAAVGAVVVCAGRTGRIVALYALLALGLLVPLGAAAATVVRAL